MIQRHQPPVMCSLCQKACGSHHQRAAAVLIAAFGDLENVVWMVAGKLALEQAFALDAAYLGHRALRAPILMADPEHHGVEEREGLVEHQALHLAVHRPTPMTA